MNLRIARDNHFYGGFIKFFYNLNQFNKELMYFIIIFLFIRDNYSKPTCGMTRFHFVYLCFNHLHFTHLNFNLLPIRYPPHHQTLEKHFFIQNQNITQIKNTNPLFFSSRALETRKSL